VPGLLRLAPTPALAGLGLLRFSTGVVGGEPDKAGHVDKSRDVGDKAAPAAGREETKSEHEMHAGVVITKQQGNGGKAEGDRASGEVHPVRTTATLRSSFKRSCFGSLI
jgi:hypothetical protein